MHGCEVTLYQKLPSEFLAGCKPFRHFSLSTIALVGLAKTKEARQSSEEEALKDDVGLHSLHRLLLGCGRGQILPSFSARFEKRKGKNGRKFCTQNRKTKLLQQFRKGHQFIH
jgi:hypothetical protein